MRGFRAGSRWRRRSGAPSSAPERRSERGGPGPRRRRGRGGRCPGSRGPGRGGDAGPAAASEERPWEANRGRRAAVTGAGGRLLLPSSFHSSLAGGARRGEAPSRPGHQPGHLPARRPAPPRPGVGPRRRARSRGLRCSRRPPARRPRPPAVSARRGGAGGRRSLADTEVLRDAFRVCAARGGRVFCGFRTRSRVECGVGALPCGEASASRPPIPRFWGAGG